MSSDEFTKKRAYDDVKGTLQFLYKYMSDPRTFLEDGFIRASQLSALNDPFEGIYCKKSLCRLVNGFFEDEKKNKSLIEYIEEEKEKIGIISLTEANDNLLMWSHYANEHKGIVICLYTEYMLCKGNSIFSNLYPYYDFYNDETGNPLFNGRIVKVKYHKQPLYKTSGYKHDVTMYDVDINHLLFDIYQCKSDEWSYEKEHRIILRLEQADRVIIQKNDINKLYYGKTIISSKFCKYDRKGKKYIIDLYKIRKKSTRKQYAEQLVKLSKEPKSIYLFKVHENRFENCILGLKNDQNPSEIKSPYIKAKNYPFYEETKLEESSYNLEFEEIRESSEDSI